MIRKIMENSEKPKENFENRKKIPFQENLEEKNWIFFIKNLKKNPQSKNPKNLKFVRNFSTLKKLP